MDEAVTHNEVVKVGTRGNCTRRRGDDDLETFTEVFAYDEGP